MTHSYIYRISQTRTCFAIKTTPMSRYTKTGNMVYSDIVCMECIQCRSIECCNIFSLIIFVFVKSPKKMLKIVDLMLEGDLQ